RSPRRARPPGGRAGCRALHGRWRPRIRAWRAPGARAPRSRGPPLRSPLSLTAAPWSGDLAAGIGDPNRAPRNPVEDVARRWQVPTAPGEPSRERFDAACLRRILPQTLQHLQILPFDHRPGVVRAEVVRAVRAETRVERPIRFEGIQRFG